MSLTETPSLLTMTKKKEMIANNQIWFPSFSTWHTSQISLVRFGLLISLADQFTFEKGFYAKMKAASLQRQAKRGTMNVMKGLAAGMKGAQEEEVKAAPTANLMGKLLTGNK